MRRAVLYGDGWAPSLITPQALAGKAAHLREIADELRRPVPWISVGGHALLAGETEGAGLGLDGGDWPRQAELLTEAPDA